MGGAFTGDAYPAGDTVAGVNQVAGASLEGTTPTLTYYSGTSATGTPLTGTPNNTGTYTVLASFAGSTDYTSASATATFTITQAALFIPTLSVVDNSGAYNGTAFTAIETVAGTNHISGASLENVTPTLTYFTGNTTATSAALSGAPTTVGTYTVVSSFSGSTDYMSGAASTTFTISQATPSVSVTDASAKYTGSAFTATTASIESVTPSLTYYSGTSATGTALSGAPTTVGTYTVLASFAGSTDYTSGTASTTFTISQANPTLSLTDNGGAYTGAAYAAVDTVAGVNHASAASLEGSTPSLTYYSGTSATGTALSGAPTTVGTYTVLASFAGSTDYTSCETSTTFTISQAAPNVSVTDASGSYTTAAFTATTASIESVTPSLTYYSGTSATGTALSGAPTTVGTYTVLASFAGSTDYTSGTATATFTIGKATPSVSVTDGGGTFSGAAVAAGDTVSGVGTQSAAAASLESVAPTLTYYTGNTTATSAALSGAPTTVGTYTVLASFAGSTDYTSSSASTTFTISQANPTQSQPTLSVTDASGNYTGAAFTATSASIEGVTPSLTYYSGTSATGTALSGAPTTVGTYTVLASFAGSTDFTSATVSTTFTIGLAAPTLSLTDNSAAYNGAAFTATDTVAGVSHGSGASLEGATPSLTYYSGNTTATSAALSGAPTTVGTYTVLASFAGSTDYKSCATSATFTISQAAPSVSLTDASGSYTGAAFTATAASIESVTPSLTYYAGTSATGSALSGAPTTVGTYTVLASFAGSTDYTSGTASTTFTISPATPNVTATDNSGAYTSAAFTATETVTGTSHVAGISLENVTPSLTYYAGTSATGTALSGAPTTVGTYTVLASFAGSTDYASGTASATFTISQATPSVSVTDGGGTYSGAAFAAGDTVSGVGTQSAAAASLESVTPSLTYYSGTSATGTALSGAPTTVGTYTVLASFAGSSDYTSASASTTFTISQANPTQSQPTLSVTDASGNYTGAAFTATSASIESVTPSLTYYAGTSATGTALSGAPTTVGTYTVLASFAGSTDFTSATVSTTFTISQAAPTVSVTDLGGTFDDLGFPATDTVAGVNQVAGASLEGVTPTLAYYSGTSATGTALSGSPTNTGTYTVLASFAGSTDYTSSSASTTFTIAPQSLLSTPTVTVFDNSGIYNDAAFVATATVAGTDNVSRSSLENVTPTLAYYSGTSATGTALSGAPSGVGTYTVVASFAGSTDYNSGSASTTFTISTAPPATPTLSVFDSSGTYNGAAFTASDTVAGSNHISGASLENVTPTLAYYAGTSATGTALSGAPTTVGTYTVLASFAGSTDYTSASASTTFTISQASPTQSAAPLSVTDNSGPYTGSGFTATAASIEGVAPTFTYYSGTSATGTALSGAPTTVGTYTVLASFAGSTDYTSGTVSTTFTIDKAAPTVTVTDTSGPFTDAPFVATATGGVGSTPTLTYYSGTIATGTALAGAPTTVGTYTVVANLAGSSEYTSGIASTTFTISQTAPTVSVTDASGAYNAAAFPATDSVAGVGGESTPASSLEGIGLSLRYYAGTSASGSALAGAPTTVGTYTVLASFAGSTDYMSGTGSTTFTIGQAVPTVSVTDAGGTYNAGAFAAADTVAGTNHTAAYSLEGVTPTLTYYSGTSATGTASSGAPTTVGTYTVLASFAGSTDYASASASTTFTISSATPTVTVTEAGGTYNGGAFSASDTVAGVNHSAVASLEGVAPTLTYYAGTSATGTALSGAATTAGTYTVLASFAGSTDYTSAAASTTFTIAHAAPTVAVSEASGTYNASAFSATETVTGVNHTAAASLEGVTPTLTYYAGASATGTALSGAPTTVGTYTVVASFAGSTDYASASSSAASFQISKAVATVVVSDASGAFNGVAFTATDTVAGVGSQSTAGASLEGNTPTLTYYKGVTALSGAPSTMGTYSVVASFAASTDYNSASSSTTFTIGVAAPTLSVTDAGGPYTSSQFPAAALVNSAASSEGITPTIVYYVGTSASGSSSSTAPTTAGTYTALASFAGSSDYSSAKASVTFTITPAAPTLTVTDNGGVYTGTPFAATDTVAGVGSQSTAGASLELVAPTLTYYSGASASGTALSGAPTTVGTYTVLASFVGSTDYGSTSGSATFSITQATPTVTVADASGIYNGAAFNATTTVAGVASVEGVAPTLTYYSGTSATGTALSGAPSSFGTYTVVASFAGSTDYRSASSGPATFTISEGAPTVAVTDASGSYNGSAFAATVTVAGAASLENVYPTGPTYYSGTSASGTALTGAPSAIGTYTVAASFAGSTDYTSAVGSTTFTISQATPTVTVSDAGGTFNGSAFAATDTVAGVGSQSTAAASLEGVTPTLTYYSGTIATGTALSGAPSAVGTYTVLASFAGSTDYTSAATSTTFTIVNSALSTPTVTVSDGGGTFNGGAFVASETVAGTNHVAGTSLEGVTPTLSYFSGTSATGTVLPGAPTAAGTYTVLASFVGSADYRSASATATYTIGQATPTVTVSDAGGGYNNATPFPATETVAGVNHTAAASLEGVTPTLTYYAGTSATGTALTGVPSTVGTYTVVASFAGSTDYTSASSSAVSFNVTKGVPTVAVSDAGGASNGSTPYPATATVAGGASLEGVYPTLTYYKGVTALSGAPSAAGTYSVVASFAGSTDYGTANASITFTITGGVPTLSVTDFGGNYTSYTFPATALVNGQASLEGATPTLLYYVGTTASGSDYSTAAPKATGTYTAYAFYQGSADWTSVSASTTFTITPAAPTLTLTDAGGTYSGSTFPAAVTIAGVGTQSTPGANLEYVAPTLSYYSGTTASGTALAGAPSAIGTYTVVANFAGSGDYVSQSAAVQFTIAAPPPAVPTLTVTDNSGGYNGSAFVATYVLEGTNRLSVPSLEGVTPTLSYFSGTSATGTALPAAPSAQGTYTVLASFAGSLPEYTSAAASTTFTITPGTPTVTVTDNSGTYTGSAFTATAKVAGAASLEGVTPTIAYYSGTSATGTALGAAPSTTGTYTVLASFAGSTDYNSSSGSTTFSIAPAVPSVSVTDATGGYNGNAFAATDTVAGAPSLEGVTPTLTYYSGTKATGTALSGAPSAIGTYTVLASFAGSTDYSTASASTTFDITKPTPTLVVSDASGGYNGAAFTATDTVNGLASLEGVTPTLSYYKGVTNIGAAPSSVGTYTVYATFAGSSDYNSTTSSATFTISKGTPTVTVSDAGGTYNGTSTFPATATVAATALATPGPSLEGVAPTVIYYPGTATSGSSGTTAAPKLPGTYTAVATFQGSTDYGVASADVTFTVLSPPDPYISAASGNLQTAAVYSPFAQPLVANVVDASGNPVVGAAVTFTAPTSGAGGTFAGGVTSVVVLTDASGNATAPTFTANGVAGTEYKIVASTPGAAVSTSFTQMNQNVAVIADPINPGEEALFIGGAPGNDQIRVQPSAQNASELQVIITDPTVNVNQAVAIPTGGFSRLVIYGGPDQNSITVDGSVTTPTTIYADGSVSNTVQAGSGPTVVIGGSGTNTITGGSGHDILIAGSGQSSIQAGSGDALLIGGTTAYDANDLALQALLNEWNSAETLSQRVANLGNGSITAGALNIVLNSSTVQSNEKGNTLQGSSPINNDVFFANLSSNPDTLTDDDDTEEIY
jgi:hypothetical protein